MSVSRKRNKRIRKRSRRARRYKAIGGSNSWGEDCKYISSRAIMKLCKVHSKTPKSSTPDIDDLDFTNIIDGSTVYITGTAIPAFVKKLDSISNKIILVSGDCDKDIPNDVFPSYDAFKSFIESDKIIHWFTQNCVVKHPKLSAIPIGLNYHTRADDSHWMGPNTFGVMMSPSLQEAEIEEVKSKAEPLSKRLLKCYSNYHFSRNADFKHIGDREDAIAKIPADLIFYEPLRTVMKDGYINQSKYAFVPSPYGNGLDCHRTWEALILGSIPIVKTSPIDSLYDDLPVLIIKDWSEVTKQLLESTLADFKDKKYNYDKLTLKYWIDKINSANIKVGGNPTAKKEYHIDNKFHYGDNIFNLKFFFNISQILKDHNIIINYYYDTYVIKNADELTRYVNPEVVILKPIEAKPADSYEMWMGKYEFRDMETAMPSMYKDALKYLGLDNLGIDTSLYQKEDYLLDIYNKLDSKFKDLKILILNGEPKSNQFPYDKEKFDAMCIRLASNFKVAVISPVNNIPCTLTDGLKLQDIGAISTHAAYIIGFNSGPMIPCFNTLTKNKVKKWIIFDKIGTKLKEVNAVFFSKDTNIDMLNEKNIQSGGSKYIHKTKKQKKYYHNINQKGNGTNFIFCFLSRNGLGNQLFLYANALIIQSILKIPIILFNDNTNNHSSVDYRVFFKKGESKNEKEFEQRINTAESLPDIVGYDEKPYLSKISEYKMKDIKLTTKYNHIYNLIKDVIPVIKTDFITQLKSQYPKFETSILDGATRENLAFMHVRNDKNYKSAGWNSSNNYFAAALNIIDTIPEINIIYIVSDDIKHCKTQIKNKVWKSTKKIKIFDEPDELKCMYLMSLCNGGAILSASTFSWWGAMFGANDSANSIILYPDSIKYKTQARLSFPEQVGNKWRAITDTTTEGV